MRFRYLLGIMIVASFVPVALADNDPYGDPLPVGAVARLGTLRYRLGQSYTPVVGPDAKTIYARNNLGLRRFDVLGAALPPLPPGSLNEAPLAFSADGSRALTSYFSTAVWNVAGGKPILTHKRSVYYFDRNTHAAHLSGDGKVVVLGASKKNTKETYDVLVWDVDADKEITRFVPPQNEQAYVAASHDGKMIATWGTFSDPTNKTDSANNPALHVHFWDATTGKPIAKTRPTNFIPNAVAFSPDGKLAAIGGSNTVELVDPKTGQSKHLLLGVSGVGHAVEFSSDGASVFGVSYRGVVQSWRVTDGMKLSTTEPPVADLFNGGVRPTAADRGIGWGTKSSTVFVWDVPSGKLLGPQVGHLSAVTGVTVTPDSKFVLSSGNDLALQWELATGKLIGPAPGHPWRGRQSTGTPHVTFSRGGAHALISDLQGYGVHDGATGQQQFVIPTYFGGYQKVVFTPDASKVISMHGSYDPKREPSGVNVWDVATAKRAFHLKQKGHAASDAALTPDGKHLIIASRVPEEKKAGEAIITAWELPGGAKKSEFREEAGYGYANIATAGDNKSAAVINSKGKLVRFDIETGKVTPVDVKMDSFQTAAVFAADGKTVALVGSSSFQRPAPVVVMDWETGKTLKSFVCPDLGPLCAAFSPDGRYLVTGTNQATVLVWDLTK